MEANPNVEIKAGGDAPPQNKGPVNPATANKMLLEKKQFPFDGETDIWFPVTSTSGNVLSHKVELRVFQVTKKIFSHFYHKLIFNFLYYRAFLVCVIILQTKKVIPSSLKTIIKWSSASVATPWNPIS